MQGVYPRGLKSTTMTRNESELPDSHTRQLRVMSADTLVAGTHFLAAAQPAEIASKALAVNLSDLAAMGAEPLSICLVLGNPPEALAWQREFLAILQAQCHRYQIALHDIHNVDGPRQISIQALGRVPESQALRRDTARAGDDIYVSGTLGDAGLGLRIASGESVVAEPAARDYCLARFHRPTPRIELGLALRGISHCAIDLSDGLCGDIGHICERSAVGALIQAQRLPLSQALRAHCAPRQARDLALSAGDDYELCFTAPRKARDQILGLATQLRLGLTRIGRIEPAGGLQIRDAQGRELAWRPAYQHFLTPQMTSAP